MKTNILPLLGTGCLLTIVLWSCQSGQHEGDWPQYLGDEGHSHYSRLDQINVDNVDQLIEVWEYHSLDSGEMQCNPIVVDGVLYGHTAKKKVFALDGKTGQELWKFIPPGDQNLERSRGLTYWEDGEDRRILASHKSYLYALDANTGHPIPSFGDSGRVSLKAHLVDADKDYFVVSRTPGALFENSIIMPLTMQESAGGTPGYVRAIDVRDGSIKWTFKTIPEPGEYGYETWPTEAYKDGIVGGANSWAGMAVDVDRGIVFVPTGSASPDFFGGNRKGQNLFANCLLALDANTGERLWHYQFVHHDIWDRDLPAPPTLAQIRREGQLVDVVTQTTKTGHVYVFDRETGESMFPIDTIAVPASPVAEEAAWPVQPLPTLPKPFSRQSFEMTDINPYSPYRDSLMAVYQSANKGLFMPLSKTPTILFPGCDGGAEWGGTAVDPNGILYVNSNEMAWYFTISPKTKENIKTTLGQWVYRNNCASCHQNNLAGLPDSGYPALDGLSESHSATEILTIVEQGRGRMPGFTQLKNEEKQALVKYLMKIPEEAWQPPVMVEEEPLVAWQFDGYKKFLDQDGNPALSPPWGQLTAIDLNTGEHLWQIPLGEDENLSKQGVRHTGTENYGGPVVTEGGVLFIAATKDRRFRAFDKSSGQLLWETELPAAGFATPTTYMIDGRQYVTIACGGGKLGTKKGDSYLTFALASVED
ncbi:outer membrane protein assembly factor BamB family protein [Membranihabitans marinus]|uniref:outer membrane protein assembly factor BamB family protein n=1 Tax=Membranihabitans marinus TaxID=1227546 RepID=UPI001F273305|nr:PQQ-binding-like beta-propeller repeat protein [Membranihabitans marinus]